jgi:hypothetical protein
VNRRAAQSGGFHQSLFRSSHTATQDNENLYQETAEKRPQDDPLASMRNNILRSCSSAGVCVEITIP